MEELNTALKSLPVRVVEPAVELIKPAILASQSKIITSASTSNKVAAPAKVQAPVPTKIKAQVPTPLRTQAPIKAPEVGKESPAMTVLILAVFGVMFLALVVPFSLLQKTGVENTKQTLTLNSAYKTLETVNASSGGKLEEGKMSVEEAIKLSETVEPKVALKASSPEQAVEDVVSVSVKDGKYVLSSRSSDGRLHTLTADKDSNVLLAHEH